MGKNLAPKPSDVGDDGKKKDNPAKTVLWIRVKDQWTSLAIYSVPTRVRGIVRKATGNPFDMYADMSSFGLDSVIVLFWIGRVMNGEPFLTLKDVEREYPYESIGINDWELSPEPPEGVNEDDSPEA